ncbi:M16 family metallopeptidase [Ovoidimarina sediminis]|uniref:M16 family metallopeptidase n=1 Tax=Ovoidimarina sediminis TaxID=3079856 RepID=UPI00290E7EB8|nr:pitrilysin family protein [Rhodophyticola sp. MJ-SS7]MDU8943838.1 pitrilysin family protein [Rhodophyticola sp. MJ-SS7]
MIRFAVTLAAFFVAALPAQAEVDITEVTTPGGFSAWLVEEHSIPFVAVEFRFKGGTSLDAEGKRGATNLMTAMIEEGAGEMDAIAFSKRREELATSIGFSVHDDALSVSFRFLTENRDASVELLKTALTDPRFDQTALERVRAQVLSSIRSSETDPSEIAQSTFNAMAWGSHPYGSSGDGTIDSVTALTRDDIFDAHAAAIAKDRAVIGAVGDITPEELVSLIDEVLGDLPETGAPLPEMAELQLEPGITVVPFETPQAVAFFGHEGLSRDDDDFFAAYIVNEIFGGHGLESRLHREVRAKRGLTYGIGAYLSSRDYGDLLIGQVSTVNGRMRETVDVLTEEWRRIAGDGITAEELEAAQTYLTGAYPLRFDGNAQIARILVGMQMDDLPIDYIATRNDRIRAVTLEEANRVAARIYRPEDLQIVIAGEPEGIEPSN